MWQFVHAWAMALVACVIVFAFVPAVTAYVHYGLTHADTPFLTVNAGWRPAQIIADLRSGAIRELGVRHMAGLITFPSFHAAGAVMLGWGFRRVPIVGIPFVMLNFAMLATIPIVGSHYFIDVLAGVAVAALAIVGSRDSRILVGVPKNRPLAKVLSAVVRATSARVGNGRQPSAPLDWRLHQQQTCVNL